MMFLSVSKFPGLFSRAVAKRPMVGQTGIMLCAHAMATILVPPSVGPTRRHSHGRGRTARISHVNRTIRTTMVNGVHCGQGVWRTSTTAGSREGKTRSIDHAAL